MSLRALACKDTMSQTNHNTQDLALTLTVGQLRALVRDEIQAEVGQIANQDGEHLLTIEEAAQILSVSPDWIYRNAKRLPFTRKLGPKMLRFSHQGLLRWLATRKVS